MKTDITEIKQIRVFYGQITNIVNALDILRYETVYVEKALYEKHLTDESIEKLYDFYEHMQDTQSEIFQKLQKHEKSYAKNIGKKRKQNKRVCV